MAYSIGASDYTKHSEITKHWKRWDADRGHGSKNVCKWLGKKVKKKKMRRGKATGEKKTGSKKGNRWVSKALAALLGWKRMPLIMRCLFYPPALCLSHCNACFPLAPIISALEPGDNNEFTEIEKCLGLNCMYLVTQTEAMAWERLVSQWHHLATQPL